jgi:subtilisin family serine protease
MSVFGSGIRACVSRAAPLALATWLAASAAAAAMPDGAGNLSDGVKLAVYPAVTDSIARTGWASVLVGLHTAVPADAPLAELEDGLSTVQDQVLDSLSTADFVLKYKYDYVPVIAGRVSASGLAKLRANPFVASVDDDVWVYPAAEPAARARLAESVPSIRADEAHALGVKGQGVGVAVVDTGIDNEHPDLADAIVDQACFSSGTRSCAPGGLPRSDNAQDEHGHGTGVSGIVLGRGAVAPVGVAPEAKLIGVRVFRDQGGAPTSDIVDGLTWVIGKQSTHNIRVVNMSLGSGAAIGVNCDGQFASVKQVFQSLVSRKIAIFVATGNGGNPDRVAFPACISNSTGVGSTWDAELQLGSPDCHGQTRVGPFDITCYTDRGRAMDLLAPGSVIVAPRLGGGSTNGGHGTSYASPHAAGVAALVFSAKPDILARDIEGILQRTGDVVIHPESGDEVMRVNALSAVLSVLPATPTATPGEVEPTPPTATPTESDRTPTATLDSTPTDTPAATHTSEPTSSVHATVYLPAAASGARR